MISIYFAIQNKNFLFFLREAKYKYKNKTLSFDDLKRLFFESFNLVSSIVTEDLEGPIFLNNKDYNNNFS